MSATAAQPSITELLEMEGARPAGARRFNCPDCGGRRTVAVDDGRGLFHCHHAGCDFRGGIGTLRKRLGLRREWLPRVEYFRQQRERERAHEAVRRLVAAVHARCMELLGSLHGLNRLEALAHDAGASEARWEILGHVYCKRSRLLAKLTILENCGAVDLIRFLSAETELRERVIDGVLMRGGLYDAQGRFVEIE